MKRETQTAIIIAVLALLTIVIVYLTFPAEPFFSPPVQESCSPPAEILEQISATGSSKFTLSETSTNPNSLCLKSVLYAGALRNAQSKAQQNALTLCKDSPPKRITCENAACSPQYTEEPNCEIQYPILTEIKTTTNKNILTCEVIATAKVRIQGEYQCFSA